MLCCDSLTTYAPRNLCELCYVIVMLCRETLDSDSDAAESSSIGLRSGLSSATSGLDQSPAHGYEIPIEKMYDLVSRVASLFSQIRCILDDVEKACLVKDAIAAFTELITLASSICDVPEFRRHLNKHAKEPQRAKLKDIGARITAFSPQVILVISTCDGTEDTTFRELAFRVFEIHLMCSELVDKQAPAARNERVRLFQSTFLGFSEVAQQLSLPRARDILKKGIVAHAKVVIDVDRRVVKDALLAKAKPSPAPKGKASKKKSSGNGSDSE